MKNIYLTIDDSPSPHTDALTDFLKDNNVPAILFVRGAMMDEPDNFAKIVRAITKGCVIGNHSYAHERTSEIGFDKQTEQILKTQTLIDSAYDAAQVTKPPRYFRFPHLDRGCGNAWVIDFATVPPDYRAYVQNLFWDGVRLESQDPPTADQIALKSRLQQWLADNGFKKLPTPQVTHPWWGASELGQAIDSLITFSTADWMLTPRHVGKWPLKTLDDVKHKIASDPWLNREDSAHIVLCHDDREDSLTLVQNLVMYFLNQDFRFLTF